MPKLRSLIPFALSLAALLACTLSPTPARPTEALPSSTIVPSPTPPSPTGVPATNVPPTLAPTSLAAPTDFIPPTATVPPLPSATSLPAATATSHGDGTCSYRVTYVADVTVPDNTVFAPGTAFVKTWRVRNDGTCTWGQGGYALHSMAFAGGHRLGAPETVEIPVTIPPGYTADLNLDLTAPAAAGTYLSEWKLKVDDGPAIGVGADGSQPLYAQIIVTTTTVLSRPNGPLLHAVKVATPPAIDGNFGDWAGLPYTITTPVYRPENWTGPADQSATFALSWDGSYLYLAAKVVDDVHVQTQLRENIFKGDSLEILLDADLAGDFNQSTLDGDDYQLGLTPGENRIGGPDAYLWFPTAKTGRPANVSVMAHQDESGNGYYLEAAIPWSVFGLSPVANNRFGFVLSSSDNDTPGAAEQQTLLSTDPARKLTDPTTWGTLVLDP